MEVIVVKNLLYFLSFLACFPVSLIGMKKQNPLIPIVPVFDVDCAAQGTMPKLALSNSQLLDEKLRKEKSMKDDQRKTREQFADDQEAAAIKRVLKKKYGLSDPDSDLQEKISQAFKVCGINPKDMVVMQCDEMNALVSSPCVWIKLYPYHVITTKKIMVIGSLLNKKQELLLFGIYHECGHIVHGDQTALDLLMGLGISMTANLLVQSSDKYRGRSYALGVLAILSSLCIGRILGRSKEYCADNFATQKLIEQNKFSSLVAFFNTVILMDSKKSRVKHFVYDDHPMGCDRACNILKLLLANKIDIFSLEFHNDMPIISGNKEGFVVSDSFIDTIKRNFPDMYVKFVALHENTTQEASVVAPVLSPQALAAQRKRYALGGLLSGLGLGAAYIGLNLWNKK